MRVVPSPLRKGVRFTLVTDPYQVQVITMVTEAWIWFRPEGDGPERKMARREWLSLRKELLG